MLFFAYGGPAEVSTFLSEASAAAESFRKFNPNLNIAVVTNNATVDRTIFTHHIVPRDDLLFKGSNCPDVCRHDDVPRQWTTRLYYMALSPFEITWALDSNTYQCPGPFARNAVHRYLDAAYRSKLFGYDIAHGNDAHVPTQMRPHCFDMIWQWNERTSNVFRDWFMLMLRRGIAKNDQQPLQLAEARQIHSGGLNVGQVPTEFAAALYSVKPNSFWPRVSRRLSGPAQIVHATPHRPNGRWTPPGKGGKYKGQNGPAFCRAFNAHRGVPRQVAQLRYKGPIMQVHNESACQTVLGLDKCRLLEGGMADPSADGELVPAALMHPQVLLRKVKW